jgi:hypothetical protein
MVHRYFVVCLVGVWQRNFEPVVCLCVCTVRPAGPAVPPVPTDESYSQSLPDVQHKYEICYVEVNMHNFGYRDEGE